MKYSHLFEQKLSFYKLQEHCNNQSYKDYLIHETAPKLEHYITRNGKEYLAGEEVISLYF